MEKYISIEKLDLGRKISNGSCANIYEFEPGIYFKMFNEEYRDLNDSINREFLDTIVTLSKIDNIPSIVKAIDIYRTKFELFGYTMPIVDALELGKLSDDVFLSDLWAAFELIAPEIRILSNNFFKTEDIGGDNILYNGRLYLLDLDLGLVDKRYVPDELYYKSMYSIFVSLLGRIFPDGSALIPDDDFDSRFNKLKYGESDNYLEYVNDVICRCENMVGDKIKTIDDFRKAYVKTYTK